MYSDTFGRERVCVCAQASVRARVCVRERVRVCLHRREREREKRKRESACMCVRVHARACACLCAWCSYTGLVVEVIVEHPSHGCAMTHPMSMLCSQAVTHSIWIRINSTFQFMLTNVQFMLTNVCSMTSFYIHQLHQIKNQRQICDGCTWTEFWLLEREDTDGVRGTPSWGSSRGRTLFYGILCWRAHFRWLII